MARGGSGFFKKLFGLIVVGGLVFFGLAALRSGPAPEITIEPQLPAIGKNTPVRIRVSQAGRGLSDVRVELIQGEQIRVVEQHRHEPLSPWAFWGERVQEDEMTVNVGSATIKGLEEGQATLRVTADAAAAWLRRPAPAVVERTLEVILRPPSIQVQSTRTYAAQGGAEAVVYRVGPTAATDGVQAGDWWFPGHPLPGGDERDRFALFGVPFDMDNVDQVKVVARDVVGNESRASFIDRFTPRPFRTDQIQLSEEFMTRVVPAIMENTPGLTDRGGLLENYLMLNNEVRRDNAQMLKEFCAKSKPAFLWREPFLQMRNAQVMSGFADRRTYIFGGRAVDQQDHLGFDLASIRMAEIQAANDGIVVLARYFGIYGNAVLLDHGYGLMTLYGHLSNLSVEEGQEVKRGDVLGRSGATGLAGGDHLHFTVLLAGLSVDPQEWWDDHWIEDRLKLKLGDALPFGGPAAAAAR